eukprot:COSAG01_NODE_5592_length_4159_cov_12.092365_3_plen_60_part_00
MPFARRVWLAVRFLPNLTPSDLHALVGSVNSTSSSTGAMLSKVLVVAPDAGADERGRGV